MSEKTARVCRCWLSPRKPWAELRSRTCRGGIFGVRAVVLPAKLGPTLDLATAFLPLLTQTSDWGFPKTLHLVAGSVMVLSAFVECELGLMIKVSDLRSLTVSTARFASIYPLPCTKSSVEAFSFRLLSERSFAGFLALPLPFCSTTTEVICYRPLTGRRLFDFVT